MEEYNKRNNVSYAKEFEWVFDPELNEENRSVSYSYKVLWSDNKNSLESKNIILGKKGYLSIILKTMGQLSNLDRPIVGQKANLIKTNLIWQ